MAGDTLRSVLPAGNRCYFVLLDEICPTADLSNIGRPNGLAYSTGELLNMPPCATSIFDRLLWHNPHLP